MRASVGELMSFPEHLSSPAWPLLASLSAFWLRVSEKLSSLGQVTWGHRESRKKWQTKKKKKRFSKSVHPLYSLFCTDCSWYQFTVVSARLVFSQGPEKQMAHITGHFSNMEIDCVVYTYSSNSLIWFLLCEWFIWELPQYCRCCVFADECSDSARTST